MRYTGPLAAATAVLLLCAIPLVAAHGDEPMDNMNVGKDNDSTGPGTPPPPTSTMDSSYFIYGGNVGFLYAHIAFMIVGWFFVLPICVMLSLARSRFSLPLQFSFLILNAIGLLLGIVYNSETPDLYVNNAHHKLGWFATWAVCAQVTFGLIFVFSGRTKDTHSSLDEQTGFLPVSMEAMAQYQQAYAMTEVHDYRWSNDSGQGTERNSASLHSGEMSPTVQDSDEVPEFERFFKPDTEEEPVNQGARWFFRNTFIDRLMTRWVPELLSDRLIRAMEFMYDAVDRLILLLGFIAVTTGLVTYGGIFHGDNIFNGLAHFVKGGIFFWYGLLTLGRWMGCFAELGWAWNIKPSRAIVGRWKSSLPSAEFTESFVIFIYGCTNVFLEHLAAWGDRWAPEDLEHVSISIMFFGGGLCGMLVESTKVRGLLNASFLSTPAIARMRRRDESWETPKTYHAPLNPMPALIILLLGIMMSSHHQHSMLSTMIHKQWGTLLMGFSLVRGVTYLLLYISPPTTLLPSRPPTEIVSAFCLISGGIIFMASNRDTVEAMERYDLNGMFAFTLTMGFTAFLMAWEIIVLAVKGWALRRETKPARF